MKNKLFENRGLTLVELILSVAILSIVITFIFTFFNFNYNTFLKSSTKYNIQTNLNQTIRTIEKDLKYADEVSLYPDKEFGGEKNYIYIEDNIIKIKKANGNKIDLPINEVNINDQETYFKLNKNLVTLDIKGKYMFDDKEFRVRYTIELLNYSDDNGSEGFIIEYANTKGDDIH